MENEPASGQATSLERIKELLGLGDAPKSWSSASLEEALRKSPRTRLIECARWLGIKNIDKMKKDALISRIQGALRDETGEAPQEPAVVLGGMAEMAPAAGGAPVEGAVAPPNEDQPLTAFPQKFDLGRAEQEKPVQHIPWGYGYDRVTAMPVDPDKLYVYWEVTDDSIERARADLGSGGRDAWLSLRVYDITGRIFDGTNAHAYFDHQVDRSDRQWFFAIGKPTSTHCVEVGLKSREGYFAKIARSGRVEFPRKEPVPWTTPEWLTVRSAVGEIGPSWASPPAPPAGMGGEPPPRFEPAPLWDLRRLIGGGQVEWRDVIPGRTFEHRWQWEEFLRGETIQGHARFEWQGPVTRTIWEAGPFTYAVESPAYVEERYGGNVSIYAQQGRTHIVYGPWQVVIRGLGARAERRILATWEIYRSWVSNEGYELRTTTGAGKEVVPVGASEQLAVGASEIRWLGASELRLAGASEIFYLGASEIRLGGASETLFQASSQWLMRGASERMYAGASETRYGGASETLYGGASESLWAGASERMFGGASEVMGASERMLGGASESLASPPPGDGGYPRLDDQTPNPTR